MSESPAKTLTIFYETPSGLKREHETFRRIAAARLRYESEFDVVPVEGPLTATDVANLCASTDSTYVLFVHDSHRITPTLPGQLIEYLRSHTVYLAEPRHYTGSIPVNVAATEINDQYYFRRDTDLYGVAFHRRRLLDLLDPGECVPRTMIYINYRLYWSISRVQPLSAGYSVASDTKSVRGFELADAPRTLSLMTTTSRELRIYILRVVSLLVKGARVARRSFAQLNHLRDVAQTYELASLINLVQMNDPIEAAWIQWLDDPEKSDHLFKQLTDADVYLEFSEGTHSVTRTPLYEIQLQDTTVAITRTYREKSSRASADDPAQYDFYAHPITPDSVILFFDRPGQAGDNAEYLYEYFTQNNPEYRHAYFALAKSSPDWYRLEHKGFRLVPMWSPEFYSKFLTSDLVVSSQIYNLSHKGKTLANSRFVYLQHGIQLNDMTDWIAAKYFDIFVATGDPEARYLRKVAPVETLNSGIPRLQTLARTSGSKRYLLFAPTWRFGLHQSSPTHFKDSEYFKAIDSLLTDPRLLDFLERTDRTLFVKLHPNLATRRDLFRLRGNVQLTDLSYRDAITGAEMVFTDYSSVVLDAAYIEIPIAYYQWDATNFFDEQPYTSRLDYAEAGLGPVFFTHEDIVKHLCSGNYPTGGAPYGARKAEFFEGIEQEKINQTIVDRMLSL